MIVAELFGLLGFKVDKGSLERADGAIDGLSRGLSRLTSLATTALAGLGFGKVIGEGIKFNANLEETRNQIAGMLALAKHTDLADQLGVADGLMSSLQKRAKALPGSLGDYTKVLGMIAQPIADAGLSMQDLEDITVGASVAAMSMKIDLEAAARDVNQAIMGQFHATDQLTGRILGSLGYVGEEGRQRFNALSKAQRAAVLKAALTQKQLAQLADAQSKTASGRWDTFRANIQETLGRVAEPLFRRLNQWLQSANEWLEKNADTVDRWADSIGEGLAQAFEFGLWLFGKLRDLADYMGNHPTLLGFITAVGIGIALWLSPLLQVIAALTAIIALFEAAKRAADALGGAIDFERTKKYAKLREEGKTDQEANAILDQEAAARQGRNQRMVDDFSKQGGGDFYDFLDFADNYKDDGGSAFSNYYGGAGAGQMPMPGGGQTVTNSTTIGDITVNVPSGVTDPQGIAAAFRAEIAKAYDNRRGGRR